MNDIIMRKFPAGILLITVLVLGACSSEDTATVPVPAKKESARVDKRSTAMNGYEEVAQILREAEMEALQQKKAGASDSSEPVVPESE